MVAPLSPQQLEALDACVARCAGDVAALVSTARALDPAWASDDVFASALESAAEVRARTASWEACRALARGAAALRANPFSSVDEEAELTVARLAGTLAQSVASGPVVEPIRWMVAGYAELPPTAHAVELARRNASTYVERLDAEFAGRLATFRARLEAHPSDEVRAAVAACIDSYEEALRGTRAGFRRILDSILARGADAATAQAGTSALAELDDAILAPFRQRLAEARSQGHLPPQRSSPPSQAPVDIAALDAAMHAAFERAWTQRTEAARAAFELAIRARYEPEVRAIGDAQERQRALQHYVSQALAQLERPA